MRDRVTIAQAGSAIRRSYNQVLRLLMLGELQGGQDDEGHWWVSRQDLTRYRDERDAEAASQPAA